MSLSYLHEIRALRGTQELIINRRNQNRYTVLAAENDGSTTAYCFSTPIYNESSRRIVSPTFRNEGGSFLHTGSNAETAAAPGEITLSNREGSLRVELDGFQPPQGDARKITYGGLELTPAANGVLCSAVSQKEGFALRLTTQTPFLRIRASSKYFALMSEDFRPFMTLSALGVSDSTGNVCAPAEVGYQQLDDRSYAVTIKPLAGIGNRLLFELNLYEPKLFQDTTVDSANPQENNAFGAAAFIGNTAALGEQWLYTRPDLERFPALRNRHIKRIRLYLPNLSGRRLTLCAHRTAQRFCSFGSNWENKVAVGSGAAKSSAVGRYEMLELTELLTDPRTGAFIQSEGLIFRTGEKGSGFTAVATGDSYSAPQILEINFR